MKRIGLYETPTNGDVKKYAGLYRRNDLFLYEGRNTDLDKLINRFYSISIETMHAVFNEENLECIVKLYKVLHREGWTGDAVIFHDETTQIYPLTNFEFVGYDVCADSAYYSPLGDNFFKYIDDSDDTFWNNMSSSDKELYRTGINKLNLFTSQMVAAQFAKYCNEINRKYPHIVESEDGWRPFAVFSYRHTKETACFPDTAGSANLRRERAFI